MREKDASRKDTHAAHSRCGTEESAGMADTSKRREVELAHRKLGGGGGLIMWSGSIQPILAASGMNFWAGRSKAPERVWYLAIKKPFLSTPINVLARR